MALSPEEQAQDAARQALQHLATNSGAIGPIMNQTQNVAAQSALPPTAMQGTRTGPGWADYLGGIQQVQQAGPGGPGAVLPIPAGTKTLAREQFEESIRQFNEQMAYKRAVAAAQAARAAAAARAAQQQQQPINERALLWDHIRGVVDKAVAGGQGWSHVNQYLTTQYGNFPKEMPFDEVQQAAFNYYDQKSHPGAQAWHTPPEVYEDPRGPIQKAWDWAGGVVGREPSWAPPSTTYGGEDIDLLRRAYYGDKYDQGW